MISAAIYLLIALLSYLGSRKAGLSKGKSALVAAGVTGLAYNYGVGDKVAGWVTGLGSGGAATIGSAVPVEGVGAVAGSTSMLPSWLSGTAAKIGLGAVAGAAVSNSSFASWLPWLAGGALLLIVTR